MFESVRYSDIQDFFKPYSNRSVKGVYFYRLAYYNRDMQNFLFAFMECVKKNGVYIKDRLSNPDEKQIQFFQEMMGTAFETSRSFLDTALTRWLPRLDNYQRNCVIDALDGVFREMEREGKNDNMKRNAYTKFMCWLYYKFERILTQLGKEQVPKILYEGDVSNYSLKMLTVLSKAGCDILLLQRDGGVQYRSVDTGLRYSHEIDVDLKESFPPDFSVLRLVQVKTEEKNMESILLEEAKGMMATNAWLTGDLLEDVLKTPDARGGRQGCYYNAFGRMIGAEDIAGYQNQLLRWKMKLDGSKKKYVLCEQMIRMPDGGETSAIQRKNYQTPQHLITDLLPYITFPRCKELEVLARKAFVELLKEENAPVQRMMNRAVCMICWLKRYIPELFTDWNLYSMPVFIYYGVCRNENEAMFLKLLSRMPIDVLVICPDLSKECQLQDKYLYEKKYGNSTVLNEFPKQIENVQFGTVAYQAEQDLNTIMYQDTGIYRNQQFKEAIPVRLQTTYEEIAILWEQEAKYRPNFETLDNKVMVPVICAKVSGVPRENVNEYWNSIRRLMTEDTFLITSLPHRKGTDPNPMKQHATTFLKNRRLELEKIKRHPAYTYAFMRGEMQDYMLEKLQQLLDSKLIVGTYANGMEYTIVATVLNMDKELLRTIQKYDFTKEIPKILIVHTTENICSVEDSIMVAYLSMLGFDVAVFVPTGYQSLERNYSQSILTEYQVGEYMYDLPVPDLQKGKESVFGKLFRRN